MSNRRYTEEHEYVDIDGSTGTVGISQFAQEQLGDVVFVELPEVGRSVTKGESVAVVESVKAASEIYAPCDGTIAAVNETLPEDPALVNSDPFGAGWFFKITIGDQAQVEALMDEAAYQDFAA